MLTLNFDDICADMQSAVARRGGKTQVPGDDSTPKHDVSTEERPNIFNFPKTFKTTFPIKNVLLLNTNNWLM